MMKTIQITFILFIFCFLNSFAQDIKSGLLIAREDYDQRFVSHIQQINKLTSEYLKLLDNNKVDVDKFVDSEIQEIIDIRESRTPTEKTNYQNYRSDIYHLSSLCYIASLHKNIVPLELLGDYLMLSFHSLHEYDDNPFAIMKLPKRKVVDYPLIYLAFECGKQSLKPLETNIFNEDINAHVRLYTYALICQIDPGRGKDLYNSFALSLTEENRQILTIIMDNLDKNVWDMRSIIAANFHNRLKARASLRKAKFDSE